MQLNDVIESIGWYRAFVVLPIQTDITKNNTDTDASISISISASLVMCQLTKYLDLCTLKISNIKVKTAQC